MLESGLRQNGGVCLEMDGGFAMLHWGFSGDSLWYNIGNLGMFIFPLLTNMCYKIIE